MAYLLDNKLVVAISTRALFDLAEEHQAFLEGGLDSYKKLQREKENVVLKPGTGFPLVQGLLAINNKLKDPAVEVVVISRNDGDSGLRIWNSIAAYGLNISRASFCGGRNADRYFDAYQCKLFLTAEPADVCSVIANGGAAALVFPPPSGFLHDRNEVRIAFDADAVIFSDEAEQIFKEKGLAEFQRNERDNARVPLSPGPFKPFLQAVASIQSQFKTGDCPLRTALVTARNAPAHERAIRTLRDWNITVDEMHFLGGIDKSGVLQIFNPHIFFDDQQSNLSACSKKLPSAQVMYGLPEKKPVASVPIALPSITGKADPA
ncbi:MAG TPA: 5'-nucleotidase [Terriglobales bacterium]|nr:5'-nucleotidase [Terriglobales bacterium]